MGKTSSSLHWNQERSPWLHLKLHQGLSAFYGKVQIFWQQKAVCLHQNKGQSYYLNSCWKGKASIKKASLMPLQIFQKRASLHPLTHSGHHAHQRFLTAWFTGRSVEPNPVPSPALRQAQHPSWQKKKHFEPRDLEWQASVTRWSKPAESHTRRAYWKAAGVWAQSGDVLLPRDPPVQGQPSEEKVGEVCKASRVWTRAGEYHTCIPRHSTSTRKKETRKETEQRRYTPENSPMGHVQRSTERQGKKRKWKKDQSVTETNKIKFCSKKKINNDSAISMSKGMK